MNITCGLWPVVNLNLFVVTQTGQVASIVLQSSCVVVAVLAMIIYVQMSLR